MYRNKLVKAKSCKVNWFMWLWKLDDPSLLSDYSEMRNSVKCQSINRTAYYVLRKHYSTTAIKAMKYLTFFANEKGISLHELLSSTLRDTFRR